VVRWLVFAGFVLLAAIVQVTLLAGLATSGIYVDLLLLVAVYASWHAQRSGPVAAWLCGWAKDLFSHDTLGINALVFLCVGLVVAKAGRALSRRSIHTVILVAMVASAASNVFLGTRALVISGGDVLDYVRRGVVGTMVTSLVAPILFRLARRLGLPARFPLAGERYV